MTDRELKSQVIEVLEQLDTEEIVGMWNVRCENWHYTEDYIEQNNPDEFLCGQSPAEVLRHVDTDKYSLYDTYAVDTTYGWRSFDYVGEESCPIELSDLADYIITECDDMDNDDIEQLFIQYDNDNMEEE